MRKLVVFLLLFNIIYFSYGQPRVIPCDKVIEGLIAYYPFDGNTNDVSGYGNNATIMGAGISLTTDRFKTANKAYDFASNLEDGIIFPLKERNIVGVSLWFNASSFNSLPYPTLFILDDNTSLNTADITPGYFYSQLVTKVSAKDDLFARVVNIGDDFDPISNVVTNDVWHHYYCSYDGQAHQLKVYLDGQLLGKKTVSSGITLNNNYLRLGRCSSINGNTEKFLGQMDDIRVYNRVLSDCEIAKIYNCDTVCELPNICISTNELKAYYPFKGNANDVSGNNNHGNVIGAILTTDRYGNSNSAYNFSGGTSTNPQYIYFSNDQSKKVSGDKLSISVWVKITGDGINYGRIFLGGSSNLQYGIYKSDGTDDKVFLRPEIQGYEQNFGQVFTKNNLSRNVWHHIVGVYDGSKTMIYTDGRLNNSTTGVSGTLTTNIETSLTGGETATHGNYPLASVFDGTIDDIYVYNRVLSDCEIAKLYNCNTTCGIVTVATIDGLIASYPFCGNTNDVSGNGNNGSVYRATLTTDRFGNANSAYYFNGDTAAIDMAAPYGTIPGQSFTYSFWFNGDNDVYGGNHYYPVAYVFYDKYAPNVENAKTRDGALWLGAPYGANIGRFSSTINSNASPVQSISTILPTKQAWHHYAAVYDDTDKKYSTYIDGALDTQQLLASNFVHNTFNRLSIGREYDDGVNEFASTSFKGKLDDIKIYNKALLQEEITNLYNETASCDNPVPCAGLTDSTFKVSYNSPVTSDCIATLSITSTLPNNRYLWSTGETKPIISIKESGNYAVKTYNTCKSQIDTIKVTINKIADRIPNIITPNHDLVNDVFTYEGCFTAGIDFTFLVYNRWGTKVYESKSYKLDWDAEGLSEGVYYYLLTDNESRKVIKGVLQVLR